MTAGSPLRVVAVGLGPIGLAAAALALERRSLALVGAVDIDPRMAGRDVGELAGRPACGVAIETDLAAALARLSPDVILLCTASSVPGVEAAIRAAARAGADVVSSCEELLVPDLQHPALAVGLDQVAVAAGITVLGTGVNPGFVLDLLPVAVSAACRRVDRVRALRIVDAGTRREPLQRKVGAGMASAEFRRRVAAGAIGHVGMRESVALVGRALDLGLDEHRQTVEPVIAERDVKTAYLTVAAGDVAGVRNVGLGSRGGEVLVELELQMFVGAGDPRDEVWLTGDPDLHLRFDGGVPGDGATAAILVNSIAPVAAARPGLLTVLDLPPARAGR